MEMKPVRERQNHDHKAGEERSARCDGEEVPVDGTEGVLGAGGAGGGTGDPGTGDGGVSADGHATAQRGLLSGAGLGHQNKESRVGKQNYEPTTPSLPTPLAFLGYFWLESIRRSARRGNLLDSAEQGFFSGRNLRVRSPH